MRSSCLYFWLLVVFCYRVLLLVSVFVNIKKNPEKKPKKIMEFKIGAIIDGTIVSEKLAPHNY